ncbi:hypothetical protein [Planctomicrobium piriforme]|uniref:Uncharacterized protein n=1 Tax=Planctomicrobium piriforme TaxID=1576369 RepID=A0A1I3J0Z3_9PLAN|nr:hypothetical protein [Planctomicrobium piriforme]SFI53755.1 hypothetical protein SAMN05421753_11019 [Planctomicrobium piriforme]
MSYVGKILVVVQVVLSLLFMTFAGAVFTAHQNWRAKYTQTQKQLTTAQGELSVAREELTNARREFEAKFSEESQKANALAAKNTSITTQLTELKSRFDALQQERATQTGLAESKAKEAQFRQEEAEKQRIENAKMQAKLDELSGENRELKDKLFTGEEAYRALNKAYVAGLAQLAFLKRIVANAGLETDPEVVSKQSAPPPPVDGLVTEIRMNRANRVQFVEISIGSDDGLVKGNELDVVRITGQERSDWLGRIRIMDLGPDWAVGEVILPAKNGIIQKGDNVTTKLNI